MKNGIFYAVSVGPGEPELMTLKAVRILHECPVLAAPVTKGESTVALDIAGQCVDVSGKEILYLDFIMTKDKKQLEENYRKQAEKVAGCLESGRDVAMVNIGDVSVYATCSYIADFVKKFGYEAVMVPGVPSFCAAAAKLGISLTRSGTPLHIIPASYGISEALDLAGNKVLMKSGREYRNVKNELEKRGLLEHAAMVQNCGLPGEKIYRDMTAVAEDAGYFATIIVKDT